MGSSNSLIQINRNHNISSMTEQSITSYISRKFTFSNLQLAYDVRATVFNALKKYDLNLNEQFQENQLKMAVKQILGEDENEIHYVVKNALRYDKNEDGTITYDEFTNFCVEQHFGEIAIQRLHRKGYYSRGNQRIMNYQEFEDTLNYCFSFINLKATKDELSTLFQEIDCERDGWISYEDYFIFLKEYFGSKSQAYQATLRLEANKSHYLSAVISKSYAPGESPEEQFARLIYTQLRVLVLERDSNNNLVLEKNQVTEIIDKVFQVPHSDQDRIVDITMGRLSNICYQDLMRKLVTYYLCEYDVHGLSQQISKACFIAGMLKSTEFVSIQPSESVLQQFFNRIDANRDGLITKDEYINALRKVFEWYKFDTRGLPSAHVTSHKLISPTYVTSHQFI